MGDILTVSGNEYSEVQTEILNGISEKIDDLAVNLGVSTKALPLLGSPSTSSIDGYYVTTRGENVYFPVDRIQYLSKTSDGNIINLSSSTIYCYSLNANGDRVNYYRLQPFGTMEYQYYNGQYSYWAYTTAYADNSNITFGQTGINSFNGVLLFLILFVLLVIAFFKRR